jgi:hypothetical protein
VEYIQFRLERAGMPDQAVFSEKLMADVHLVSGGIPRLINTICDSLLVAGFGISSKVCTTEMLDCVCESMHLARPAAEPSLPVPGGTEDSAQASGSAGPISPPVFDQNPSLPRAEINIGRNALSPGLRKAALSWNLRPAPIVASLRTYAIDLWKVALSHPRSAVVAVLLFLGWTLGPPLNHVPKVVLDRAAITFDDDFRTGLNQWRGPGKAATAWSFDQAGFVRPRQIALYQPTVGLDDYEVQFLGTIEKRALSWVVRATDFDNYYVVKLVVEKQGPLPIIGVTRYAVVNGKAHQRTDTIAPVNARADTLYHVRLNIRGDYFTLTVQDLLVDTWSEPLLRHGGIGFFSARGEASSVRWVRVTHQFDMLGRLCASLALFKIPSTY